MMLEAVSGPGGGHCLGCPAVGECSGHNPFGGPSRRFVLAAEPGDSSAFRT